MAKKYYAIKEPAKYNGIYYEEWNNIKHLVQGNGFSIFKSFETKEEAEKAISEIKNTKGLRIFWDNLALLEDD